MEKQPMLTLGKHIKALREEPHLSQVELTKRCGGAQSRSDNYEQETREPKLANLELIAKAFGMTLSELMFGNDGSAASPMGRVVQWDDQEELAEDGYVFIQRYDLNLSTGCSSIAWVVHEKDPLAFRARYMQAKGFNPDNLKALYEKGDSMEPYLMDGDTVMVNIEDTQPKDGQVYAVCFDDEWYIKRLFKVPGGGLMLQSDNQRYRDIEAAPERAELVRVFGWMVWRGG
ncbi:LexA family transcriptional regulator [Pseudogulbenkiania sp. MAI-1]|uniref:XRE family transcriptional regulator n=1 Tax=Pseudogulbenkiania sp. MAI-1 TaxID=990370 RepID=UPI0018DCF7AB|nr:LexA family transcriptional regulator [Pseudogulbenkiania sp. MAI-1]